MNVSSTITEGIEQASNYMHDSTNWGDTEWGFINHEISIVQKHVDQLTKYKELLDKFFSLDDEMDLDDLWNGYKKL